MVQWAPEAPILAMSKPGTAPEHPNIVFERPALGRPALIMVLQVSRGVEGLIH